MGYAPEPFREFIAEGAVAALMDVVGFGNGREFDYGIGHDFIIQDTDLHRYAQMLGLRDEW